MSESLLDKLKNKPIPKKIKQLEIKIQPKKDVPVEIKTDIKNEFKPINFIVYKIKFCQYKFNYICI